MQHKEAPVELNLFAFRPRHIDICPFAYLPKPPNDAMDDLETVSGEGEGSELDTLTTLGDLGLHGHGPVNDVCACVRAGEADVLRRTEHIIIYFFSEKYMNSVPRSDLISLNIPSICDSRARSRPQGRHYRISGCFPPYRESANICRPHVLSSRTLLIA